jgi:hypothetical protein
VSDSELTLGAVLAHLEEQEREIAAQAEATRERIAELTASWRSSTGSPRRSASPARPCWRCLIRPRRRRRPRNCRTIRRFEAFAEKISGQDLTGFFQTWFRGATVPADEYLWPGTLKP